MRRLTLALISLTLAISASFTSPAVKQLSAGQRFCELALVLAMDASSSVDDREYQLQMKGMASALLDPKVQLAIESIGGIYLAAFEWNGRSNHKLIFDWVYLSGPQDSLAFATTLVRHVRNSTRSPTAIGAALGYAHRLLKRLPEPCTRQVIDVSGDGSNNEGIKPQAVYVLYDYSQITVNGLVIKDIYTSAETFYRDPEAYYREHVLHGAAAFIELANGFDDFATAMKRKLLREIVPGPIGQLDQ